MSRIVANILSIKDYTLKIEHPDTTGVRTYLSTNASASDTTLYCYSNAGFADNDIILIGNFGDPTAEITDINDAAFADDSQMDTTALKFNHPIGTPITRIDYDQIKTYTSTSETGTFALDSTINIQASQPYTVWEDADGDTTLWYKVTFYNSAGSTASGYSDAVQYSGVKERSVSDMVDIVRRLTRKKIPSDNVIKYFNMCLQKNEQLKDWTEMESVADVLVRSGQTAYDFPTNSKRIESFRVIDEAELGDSSWEAGYWVESTTTYTDATTAAQDDDTTFNAFTTTDNTGFVVGADYKFHKVVIDVATAPTGGTPIYTYTYWDGDSWETLTLLQTPDWTSTDDQTISFNPPEDWAMGCTEDTTNMETDKFYIKIMATTAPTTNSGAVTELSVYYVDSFVMLEQIGYRQYQNELRTLDDADFPSKFCVYRGKMLVKPVPEDILVGQISYMLQLTRFTEGNIVATLPNPEIFIYYACFHIELEKGSLKRAQIFKGEYQQAQGEMFSEETDESGEYFAVRDEVGELN